MACTGVRLFFTYSGLTHKLGLAPAAVNVTQGPVNAGFIYVSYKPEIKYPNVIKGEKVMDLFGQSKSIKFAKNCNEKLFFPLVSFYYKGKTIGSFTLGDDLLVQSRPFTGAQYLMIYDPTHLVSLDLQWHAGKL